MRKIYTLLLATSISFGTYGAIITVTNTNDSGTGSLRDAVANANSGDQIIFNSAILGDTIFLNTVISINKSLSILGVYGSPITISGGGNTRIFSVSQTNSGDYLQLNSLNFIDGKVSSGGAILNSSILYLNNCTFKNNTSVAASITHGGGAIYNNTGGELYIVNCVFENNTASRSPSSSTNININGGAIYHKGSNLLIRNSYFGGNKSINAGNNGNAFGGAVYQIAPSEILNCTFYDNTAEANTNLSYAIGGALYSNLSGGGTLIEHTTFYQNGVLNTSGTNTSTRAGNIYNSGNASMVFKNTIIAAGDANGSLDNLVNGGAASAISQGGNLSDYYSGITTQSTDLTGNPNLNTPATTYNNSYTKVLTFDCSSPAYNAGLSDSNTVTIDQVYQVRIYGDAIDVGAFELPAPDTSVTDSSLTLTANISGATYQWIDCDNGNSPISGATNQSFTATASGSYAVVVTENGCTDTSACITVTNVGLDKYEFYKLLNVYPNPVHDKVFIETKEKIAIRIVNMMGETMVEKTLFTGVNEIDISHLSSGVYFLLSSNNRISKLIIE